VPIPKAVPSTGTLYHAIVLDDVVPVSVTVPLPYRDDALKADGGEGIAFIVATTSVCELSQPVDGLKLDME
jgi:hypothetical protein